MFLSEVAHHMLCLQLTSQANERRLWLVPMGTITQLITMYTRLVIGSYQCTLNWLLIVISPVA